MSGNQLSENIAELSAHVKSYIQSHINLLKLEIIENLSRISTFFASVLVMIIIIASALLFFTFGFSYWFGETYGNYALGFLISGGFYILLGIIFCIFRKRIIGNKIIRSLSNIFFREEDNDDE